MELRKQCAGSSKVYCIVYCCQKLAHPLFFCKGQNDKSLCFCVCTTSYKDKICKKVKLPGIYYSDKCKQGKAKTMFTINCNATNEPLLPCYRQNNASSCAYALWFAISFFLFVSFAFNFIYLFFLKKRDNKSIAPNECMTESRSSSMMFKCSDDNSSVNRLIFATPKNKNVRIIFFPKKKKKDCTGPNTSYAHEDYFNCAGKKSCFSEYVTYENPQPNDSTCSQSTNIPISRWVYATCVTDLSGS
ncbi:hypothetical protein RFI_21708, partial [Reticulomyxa filosa]